jgi:hypothetical protein
MLLVWWPYQGASDDILEYADTHSLGTQIQLDDGTWREPKYGDLALEKAEEVFRNRPRPWTVERVLVWYASDTDVTARSLDLRLLAASRDPRGAVMLGEALDDAVFEVKIAALDGLADYFVGVGQVCCGSEQKAIVVHKWWQQHEGELRAGAEKLGRGKTPN